MDKELLAKDKRWIIVLVNHGKSNISQHPS